jgi:DDE_Tnp_1-associated
MGSTFMTMTQGVGKVLAGSHLTDLRYAEVSSRGAGTAPEVIMAGHARCAIIPDRPATGQLLPGAQALGSDRGRRLPVRAVVPDPRARREVRHRLAVMLGLAVCAVLVGARSFTAIAERAADAGQCTRDALGITSVVPCESTFRRNLQSVDADALDKAVGAWAQQHTVPSAGSQVIAVDGKTLRGCGATGQPARHLLAALDYGHGVVLGRSASRPRRTRSRCSPRYWTVSTWPGRSSSPTRCMAGSRGPRRPRWVVILHCITSGALGGTCPLSGARSSREVAAGPSSQIHGPQLGRGPLRRPYRT